MEDNKILKVKSLLYDSVKEEVQTTLSQIEDQDILYVYAYNYNWDNGFEIPQVILDNAQCDLSIALLLFYRADGARYLFDKSCTESLSQWSSFIKGMYNSILDGKYREGRIEFKIPLSKVQLFKLRKVLTEQEKVFVEDIMGDRLDITV